MSYEIRPFTNEEYARAHRVLSGAFGETMEDETAEAERTWFEFGRSLAALDQGELVATAGAYTFDLTLPGGTTAPVAGVTWVGVLQTHRRRGILRSLMGHQLDDVAERCEPIAVLTASEAVIYGRFGYGVATHYAKAEVLTRESRFATDPTVGGRIRLLDSEGARKVIPAIFDRARQRRAGMISRNDRYWDMWALDLKDWRDGGSARFVAVHENDAGVADGCAVYRIKDAWKPDHPGNTASLMWLVADDPEIEAALLRFVLDVDLLWNAVLEHRPIDDHVRWRLADSRRYCTTWLNDWLWVRLVDPAAALAARRYPFEGRLAIGVTDSFRPGNDGVYVIDGGPDGATVERAGGGVEPDVRMPIEALGSAYLGGVRVTTLAAGGRVSGTPDALAHAERFLGTTPLPFCDLGF